MNALFFDNFSGADIKENWLNLINLGTSSIRKGAGFIGKDGNAVWNFAAPMGAHWTLHYEWHFYALLPIIGVVLRSSRRLLWLVVSILLVTLVMKDGKGFFTGWSTITWAFIPGLLLGLTHRYWKSDRYLSHPLIATIAITALLASAFYSSLRLKFPANTLFLAVVLSNNTATRFLESKLLRSLGETTYSVYLLHGLVQYATLKWIVTIPIARSMPEWLWWMTCALQVVVIVIIARLSFEYVEKPGIEAGRRFYAWLMNLIERRAKWLLNWI